MAGRMVLLAMVVVSGVACQQEESSSVEGGVWRIRGPGMSGIATVPAGAFAFDGELGERIEARGLSLEEFDRALKLSTEVDLLAGETLVPKGEYRLALMLGRGGASARFLPAGGGGTSEGGDEFIGLSVQRSLDAEPGVRLRWSVPEAGRAAAQLQILGGGTLLGVDFVAVPELVKDRKLTPAALRILREAEQFTILTLNPQPHPQDETPPQGGLFHGYGITGKARIGDRSAQAAVVDTVARGISRSDGAVAACFNPRHGVRAFHRGRWVELVICYECLHMRVYAATRAPSQVVLTVDASREILHCFEKEGLRVAGR